jgi:ADP-heptose:LPS heptosyltransferase
MKRKILVIRYSPVKFFFHCLSAFRAIREKHIDDEIVLITEEQLAKIAKKSGCFDRVIIDKMSEWYDLLGVYENVKKLRAEKFDLVYDLQNDSRSEWHFRLIGYKKPEWNSSIIDWCSIPYKIPDGELPHFQDNIQAQLKRAGVKNFREVDLEFLEMEQKPDELPERYAMLCPAGNPENIAHKWEAEKYAELIDFLEVEHGIKSLLVGSAGYDHNINEFIIDNTTKSSALNIAGLTELHDLYTIAKYAVFCLGNDTAPIHMAAFAGAKTVMLCSRFSPADIIAPRVPNLAVIEEDSLIDIPLERVIKAVEEFGVISSENSDEKPEVNNITEKPSEELQIENNTKDAQAPKAKKTSDAKLINQLPENLKRKLMS